MNSLRSTPRTLGFVAIGAIAVATLGGCAGSAHLARADAPSERDASRSKRGVEKDVGVAERAVARSPQNASLRAALGSAYLQVGRFNSATTAFDDAMRLGDNSPRTALSLALAKVGAGHGREAVAILDDWRDTIPASDLGLAMALSGETTRGVAILTDSLRGGQNTAKLRQNLAYAYALDGRWREARTMVEQDIPADQVDQRISDWAMQGRAEDSQKRIASLLGAPVRSDPGLPLNLALGNSATVEQLAAEATATQPQPMQQPPAFAHGELPAAGEETASNTIAPPPVAAVGNVSAVQVAASPAYVPPTYATPAAPTVPVVTSTAVVQPTETSAFANAFDSSRAQVSASAPAADWRTPVKAQRTVRVVLPAARPMVTHNGSHLVQLGSFSSPEGARRGWGILASRNAQLREYRMVITPAVVNGKNFWRVAAAGFDSGTALGMCSSVKHRGGVCFAYAATRVPAGAVLNRAQAFAGPQFARRK
jgi:tetratricopeptide (TPR) repeat protein